MRGFFTTSVIDELVFAENFKSYFIFSDSRYSVFFIVINQIDGACVLSIFSKGPLDFKRWTGAQKTFGVSLEFRRVDVFMSERGGRIVVSRSIFSYLAISSTEDAFWCFVKWFGRVSFEVFSSRFGRSMFIFKMFID